MQTYELQIGKYFKEAWQIFCKGPELFVVATMLFIAINWSVGHIPIAGGIMQIFLSALFPASIFLFTDEIRRNEKANFQVVKKVLPMLPQLVLQSLLIGFAIIIGLFLLILPGVYALNIYLFSSNYTLFEKKNFWDGMEASRKLVNQNFFAILGLNFLLFLLVFSGLLFAGVGVLLTAPLALIILNCTFADIRNH